MKLTVLAAIPLMFTGSAALAGLECDHSAPHRLSAAVGDATRIVVVARAGTLKVTGTPGATLNASGTACSSDREYLQSMRIEARRDGSDLIVEAIIPERTMVFGWHNARLDFEVNVPDNVPVKVKDGSGTAHIRGVASLDVTDGSGELQIRDVRGNVEVEDGSGSVEIDRVGGSVVVRQDGSGGLEIRDVARDVTIENDGSGSIDVTLVRGNFTVESDGSGGIHHDRVSGTVKVPRD